MVADGKHRLHVDDGRTVDGLEGADLDLVAGQRDDSHAVEADRVGPIRRSSREHATQRKRRVASGMQLQDRDPVDPDQNLFV
jgi:hypothetical protein